jgi:hypothetical protein
MKNIPATVAALCIFNGLRLSPVQVSPMAYRFKLPGTAVTPRFTQCERYLSRFFPGDGVMVDSYMPLEVFDGQMAVAAWIRAAVGTLQYSYKSEGVIIPNAHDIDPHLWFDDLEGLAMLYNEHTDPDRPGVIKTLARMVETKWCEDDSTAYNKESNQHYIQTLYAQAGYMMERDQMLTSASGIIRARVTNPAKPGQKYPLPE